MDESWNDMKNKNTSNKRSKHWVQSHNKSNGNDTVDGYAKIAANIVQFLDNNEEVRKCSGYTRLLCTTSHQYEQTHSKCTCIWDPNHYISFNAIKNEIRYKIKKTQEKRWNL